MVSVVPDSVARSWSPSKWRLELASSSKGEKRKWRPIESGGMGAYDVDTFSSQLRTLASNEPERFVPVATAFDESVPARARASVLAGLLCTRRPQNSAESWKPLSSDLLFPILSRPCYVDEPECAKDIAWVVRDRPDMEWPACVLARLETIAREAPPSGPFVDKDDDNGLLTFRLNDEACVAFDALAAVAKDSPERQLSLLQLAEDMVNHPCPGRRASAGVAAATAFHLDPRRAANVVLTVAQDDVICAEPHVKHSVLWLARSQSAPRDLVSLARARVTGLTRSSSRHAAEFGGVAALALLRDGAIDLNEALPLLDNSADAKRAAARNLIHWMEDGDDWDTGFQLAVQWASDEDQLTADTIYIVFRSANVSSLLSDRLEFIHELLALPAASRNVDDILEAFEKTNRLLPIADVVLAAAKALGRAEAGHGYRSGDVCGRLARLMEEAEQARNFGVLD